MKSKIDHHTQFLIENNPENVIDCEASDEEDLSVDNESDGPHEADKDKKLSVTSKTTSGISFKNELKNLDSITKLDNNQVCNQQVKFEDPSIND